MTPICIYFQVHQPFRLRRYDYFDVGRSHHYFDEQKDRQILDRIAEKCYRPATKMLARLVRRHGEKFAVGFSLSGTVLEQLRDGEPDVLQNFRRLSGTGRAEFLSETYYHSLAWLSSHEEFAAQISRHRDLVERLFGKLPRVFRNTELIYSNDLARYIEELGYEAILADGVEPLLGDRSPDFLYRSAGTAQMRLLLRNYRLSDDIAFRFGNRGWQDYPLTAEKYVRWLKDLEPHSEIINLFMDFETFGEHQWKETGIFQFFEAFVDLYIARGGKFLTPSEVASGLEPRGELSAPRILSWADEDRDLSAWQGNDLQQDALNALFRIEAAVKASGSKDLLSDWRRLSTSDHFYYMSTKYFADGDVHKYFNPWESPYEAYMTFMHVLSDVERRAERKTRARPSRDVPTV
jgi:alpha-amylase